MLLSLACELVDRVICELIVFCSRFSRSSSTKGYGGKSDFLYGGRNSIYKLSFHDNVICNHRSKRHALGPMGRSYYSLHPTLRFRCDPAGQVRLKLQLQLRTTVDVSDEGSLGSSAERQFMTGYLALCSLEIVCVRQSKMFQSLERMLNLAGILRVRWLGSNYVISYVSSVSGYSWLQLVTPRQFQDLLSNEVHDHLLS